MFNEHYNTVSSLPFYKIEEQKRVKEWKRNFRLNKWKKNLKNPGEQTDKGNFRNEQDTDALLVL